MEIQLDARTSLIMAEPMGDQDLSAWQVAPEDREQWHRWLDCETRWLTALQRRSKAENTVRSYRRDVLDFFGAFALVRLYPWQVSAMHAESWVQRLTAEGMADSTINRKVAALSSFYHYASVEYVMGAGADAQALWPYPNPFGSRSLRRKLSKPMPKYPSPDELKAILMQIDITTVVGLRNMALLFGMFGTTRRVNEWRNLRWGDIHEGATGRWFEYRYKGGEQKSQVLPADVWSIVELYLKHSGRLATMKNEDYVFVATSAAGGRIHKSGGADQVRPGYDPATQPLGASYINQLVKRYGAAAGVAEEKLHAHALRHAGSRHRHHAGADAIDLKEILGHANIAITQRYIDEVLDEPEDPYENCIGTVLPRQLKLLFKG